MKHFSIVLLTVLFISCGTSVGVDYDKEVDFSQYTTYNFFPDIESGLNGLDEKRIMHATDSLLQTRGFVKSDAPQLYINFYAKENLRSSRNTIGIGVGGGGGNVGVGVSGGIPIGGRIYEQAITMDFIDVSNDDLIWQAVAKADLKENADPEQKKQHYKKVISKILKKFPPSN